MAKIDPADRAYFATWTDDQIVTAIRAAATYLSDEWERVTRADLVKRGARAREAAEWLLLEALDREGAP